MSVDLMNQGSGQPAASPSPEAPSTPSPQAGAASSSTPAPEAKAAPETPAGVTPPAGGAPLPYTPNFKFKVHNQEMEIPDWARAMVKDAESEKKAREIFEKAEGLGVVKPKLEKTRIELETLRKEYQPLKQNYTILSTALKQNDFETFFNLAGVPLQNLYQWVHAKLLEQDLPPHVQQQMQQAKQAQAQNYFLQMQMQDAQNRTQSSAEQAKSDELSTVLAKPDVAELVSSYDQKAGKPNAFMARVIQHAATIETLQEKELSVEEAVNAVLAEVKPFLSVSGQPQVVPGAQGGKALQSPQPGSAQGVGQTTPPPVIPNVGSQGSSSPTKKIARSIDDLRKLAASMPG